MPLTDRKEPLIRRHPGRRLSEVLRDIEASASERISVGDIVGALGDRSFAPLMVIFAAPNVFLFMPGSSMFTAVPLMFLAVQLVLGRTDIWLPRGVSERSITRTAFSRIVAVSVRHVERIERLTKPRWWPTSFLVAERLIGLATLVLAVLLFLPIPFANGFPALSIVMLGLGLSQRDGCWLAAGLIFTLVSVALVIGLVVFGATAATDLLFK